MTSRRIWALAVAIILLLAWMAQSNAQEAGSTEPSGRLDSLSQGAEMAHPVDWASPFPARIEPDLLKQVLSGDAHSQYRVVIELADQVDLASISGDPYPLDRRQYLVTQLQTVASQTQADLLRFLQARQATGQVQQVQSFWIFNGLTVTTDGDTLLALSARSDIHLIRQDRWLSWVEPISGSESQPGQGDDTVEWNIERVQADRAWSVLGLDGKGVTVAIMDTGVDWQHPALQMQYRGYKDGGLAVHQGNWFCTTDEGYLYPFDGYGHGTHVAGLAVGGRDATGRAIGVAPGADWIAVKMLNDAGYGYDSWIHAAFQWIMAPAGDPALAPDVINGSWGAPDPADERFRADLQALRAAGIVPVFAMGNAGPNPASLSSPGSYPEVIAVGATDDLDLVTSFSSRGPSPWDEVKPEVVAPGAQIRSSLPGGTYQIFNGTSMATPQVTGLVALLLQANPALTVDEIEALITSTARPLTDETPNNDTGWGLVDAYQAAAVAVNAGFVEGRVTGLPANQPLSAARITVYNHVGEQQAVAEADGNGYYRLALLPGTYKLTFEAFGYIPQDAPDLVVQPALVNTVDRVLSPSPAGVLWGQVSNVETNGPVSAELSVAGTPAHATSDPQTGLYSLPLPAGTYVIEVARNGYRRQTLVDVAIVAEQATRQDVALAPAPTLLLVDSGPWYYGSKARYFEDALDDGDYVYDTWEIRDLDTDLPTADNLNPYQITIWSSPLDAPGLIGASDAISSYLSTGGSLFLTGQDVGYWDGGLDIGGAAAYYRKFLKAIAVADDAGRGDVVGLADDIWHGVSLPMNGQDSAGNQRFPDSIAVLDPRDAAIIGRYVGDEGAALRANGCQSYRTVYLGAGLEGLGNRDSRAELMDRTLTWLNSPQPAVALDLYPTDQSQVWLGQTSITYTVELRNLGGSEDRFELNLTPSAWPSSLWDSTFTRPLTQNLALEACQTQTLGVQVMVPADAGWNITDVVTLTARSLTDPTYTAQAVFSSKTPAPILLIDDHRWYDVSGRYESALKANHLPYDLWTIYSGPHPDTYSPSLERLRRYPLLIWFTAYDWYATLTKNDEARLAAYLDGGGRLLLSSQDYLYTSGFTGFGRDYLGVAGYTESLTATQIMGVVDAPIGDGLDPMDLIYPFRNWSDALHPMPNASMTFWGQHRQPVALALDRKPFKTAFFAFPLEALFAPDLAAVMGRAVDWLSPLGDSSLIVDQPAVAAGDQLAYTLVIRNTGPRLLGKVSLSNTLPLSSTFVAGSLEGPAQYDPGTNRLTWGGALASDQAITIRYRLQLDDPLAKGTIVRNGAQLKDDSGLALDRVAVSRVGVPDLSASTQVVNAETARAGQEIVYSFMLRNDGVGVADARLTDPIPLDTTYVLGSVRASGGVLTPTVEALLWAGTIEPAHVVTITFSALIDSHSANVYVLNRANLDDGWGDARTLEAFTWVSGNIYFPLIFR